MSTPAPNAQASSSTSQPASKPARPPVVVPGIYPSDSVRMAAESIGVANLSEDVALGLAGDVEFRLHQVIEEAQKFMRHSRRTTMTPADINHALSALSIEPIYGHLPLPSSTPRFVPLRLPPNLAASSANAGLSSKNKSSSSAAAAASSTAALAAGGANPAASDIYFLADPEVDFAKMLAAPPPGLVGGGVRWKAHWLAVEGVMPRVPENVAPDYQAARAGKAGGAGHAGGAGAAASYLVNGAAGGAADAAGKGAKPALSQELQLYFTRLTAALLPSPEARAANPGGTGAGSAAAAAAAGGSGDAAGGAVSSTADLGEAERARLAALASLRGDTGLQGLVVYLVRWFGEKVAQNLVHLQELHFLLEAVNALIANQTLFLEPFLHQILPILLSPLLTSPLGGQPTAPAASAGKSKLAPEPAPTEVRALAAQVLGVLVREFGGVYETLVPRLTKTLLRSLAPPHPAGRVEGALLGLASLGRHAVWRALWGGEADAAAGAKRPRRETGKRRAAANGEGVRGPERLRSWVDGWATMAGWKEEEQAAVVTAAYTVLPKLLPSARPSSAQPTPVTDTTVLPVLRQTFGPALGALLASDAWLAHALLELSPDEVVDEADDGPAGAGTPAVEDVPAAPAVLPSQPEQAPAQEPVVASAVDADVSMHEEPAAPELADAQAPAPAPATAAAAAGAEADAEGEEDDDEDMEAVP